MLEKFGLPAKPSLRGSSWVVDASHCQGCSSQFTFINRKHHCRRCGGLFCNTCSRNRMVLRGQGDSPVRICEPCKTLEEAARFQARYGRKKGDDASTSTQVLGDKEHSIELAMTPDNPQQLREQALDERGKYKKLKSEGRADEALQAFKRGRELERRAAAVEKNQKKAGYSTSTREVQTNDADYAAELRDLGWSEPDIQNRDEKQSRSSEGGPNTINNPNASEKSQVAALKKKALTLKREGKIAEAMEELKKAKLLEKQLEEEKLLAEAEESDDELTSLMRGIDNDDNSTNHQSFASNINFDMDLDQIISMSNKFDSDDFDVTDDDLNDPEISTALETLGWTEGAKELTSKAKLLEKRSDLGHSEEVEESVVKEGCKQRSRGEIQKEVLGLKRKALSLRREGDIDAAEEVLKLAKVLESEMADTESASSLPSPTRSSDSTSSRRLSSHQRFELQQECLLHKRQAMKLRRGGETEAAEAELKVAKALEMQLESSSEPEARGKEDVTVEDVLDHGLLSSLKELGISGVDSGPGPGPKPVGLHVGGNPSVQEGRGKLEEKIRLEKAKAVSLKRSGRQDEALSVLRQAKILEKKLNSMGST